MDLTGVAQNIISAFVSRTSPERPFLVAIDGLSGAGKTTFAEELSKELMEAGSKPFIIHIDDHIEIREKRYGTGREEWEEYYHLQWNSEKLEKILFEKLLEGERMLELDFYDSVTDTNKRQNLTVAPDQIVLIEGIFLQREEWARFYDLTVYIDCPRQQRYERVFKRDSFQESPDERLRKYRNRYWRGEDHYLKTVNPLGKADLVYVTCIKENDISEH